MNDLSADARDGTRADARFLDRFVAVYRGSFDPLDALFWLDHADEPAPSGAPSPWAAVASARRDLYRAGADPGAGVAVLAEEHRLADEADLLHRAADLAARGTGIAESGSAAPAHASGRARPARRRTFAVVVITAAAVAAVGIAEAVHTVSPATNSALDTPYATVTPTLIDGTGGAAGIATEHADLAAMFSGPAGMTLGDYFARHPDQRPTQLANIADAYASRTIGSDSFALNLTGGGSATLFIVCREPARYTWTLTVESQRTGAGTSRYLVKGKGDDCSRLAYSGVGLGNGTTAMTLTVTVPRSTDYLVAADLTR